MIRIAFTVTPEQYKTLRLKLLDTPFKDNISAYAKVLLLAPEAEVVAYVPPKKHNRKYVKGPQVNGLKWHMSDAQRERMYEMIDQDASTKEIMQEIGCTANTIYYHRAKVRKSRDAHT